jgi:hypothetical protein
LTPSGYPLWSPWTGITLEVSHDFPIENQNACSMLEQVEKILQRNY